MEKETLYKFFDGKASREEKEAVRIWLESSPENEQMLFREREFFDAMILSGSTKSAGTEDRLGNEYDHGSRRPACQPDFAGRHERLAECPF